MHFTLSSWKRSELVERGVEGESMEMSRPRTSVSASFSLSPLLDEKVIDMEASWLSVITLSVLQPVVRLNDKTDPDMESKLVEEVKQGNSSEDSSAPGGNEGEGGRRTFELRPISVDDQRGHVTWHRIDTDRERVLTVRQPYSIVVQRQTPQTQRPRVVPLRRISEQESEHYHESDREHEKDSSEPPPPSPLPRMNAGHVRVRGRRASPSSRLGNLGRGGGQLTTRRGGIGWGDAERQRYMLARQERTTADWRNQSSRLAELQRGLELERERQLEEREFVEDAVRSRSCHFVGVISFVVVLACLFIAVISGALWYLMSYGKKRS